MALSITGGDGTIGGQARTQTPQSAVGPATGATPSGNVQHGTAASVLTTQAGGISLSNQALPTVNLDNTFTSTAQIAQSPEITTTKHHINPVLLSFAVVLFVMALIIFWATSRSAKNTTN